MGNFHHRKPAPIHCDPPHDTRRGFTLVELLVALVLLDLGIVALVAASAAVARVESAARSDAAVLAAASARVERLLATPCRGAAAASSPLAPNLSESWSDTPLPNDTREVGDSLVLTSSRGPRILVLRTAGTC